MNRQPDIPALIGNCPGNGLPDLIDEIKYELDWLKKMQDTADGKAHNKLGYITHDSANPIPDQDTRHRYYGPKCTSSTIAVSSMFAQASLVMRDFPELTSYASDLQARSIQAYEAFAAAPSLDENCDDGTIKAGDADRDTRSQIGSRVTAAVYLFQLTGDNTYQNDINTYLENSIAWTDKGWSMYQPYQGDSLLDYIKLDNARADIKDRITARYLEIVQNWEPMIWGESGGAYLAKMSQDQFHWGSNNVIGNIALANLRAKNSGLFETRNQELENRALFQLNYLNGRNPLGSSMITTGQGEFDLGYSKSVTKLYHQQFGYSEYLTGTKQVPPGYIVGGINKDYQGSRAGELTAEPIEKKYLDTNEGFPVNSWEFSEPAIYYQASLVSLIAGFNTTPSEEPVEPTPDPEPVLSCIQTRPCVIKDEEIFFSPVKANPIKFGEQDLVIDLGMTLPAQVQNCSIKYKPYSSMLTFQDITTAGSTTVKGCKAVLKKEAQTQPLWDLQINITTIENTYYQTNISYAMRYGAIGLVVISASQI